MLAVEIVLARQLQPEAEHHHAGSPEPRGQVTSRRPAGERAGRQTRQDQAGPHRGQAKRVHQKRRQHEHQRELPDGHLGGGEVVLGERAHLEQPDI